MKYAKVYTTHFIIEENSYQILKQTGFTRGSSELGYSGYMTLSDRPISAASFGIPSEQFYLAELDDIANLSVPTSALTAITFAIAIAIASNSTYGIRQQSNI